MCQTNSVTCDLHIHFKTAAAANLAVYIAWFNDRTLEMFTDKISEETIENFLNNKSNNDALFE